jgi:AcrR family transcriptional regulator
MPKQLTSQRILEAARAIFDREGERGLSMRRIATAVGITPMAIYKHFADKDALLSALMLDGLAAWEARVAHIDEGDPVAWLQHIATAFLEFSISEPRRYEAAFVLNASQARQYPGDFESDRSPVMQQVHRRIAEASVGKPLAGNASITEFGLALSGLCQGLVTMDRAGRFSSEQEFRASYARAVTHCIHSYLAESR